MPAPAIVAKAAKVAATMLTSEKGRKTLGWIIVFVLSPVIMAIILLFVFLQGGSRHNNDIINLCFYGGEIPAYTPEEYNDYISDLRVSFSLLDEQIALVNEKVEGRRLDGVRVKSIFFSLYFGLDSPSLRDHRLFTECFYTLEEREREVELEDGSTVTETYEVAVPIQSLATVYAHIASKMGITATSTHKTNASEIYFRVTGFHDGSPDFDPDLPFVGVDGFVSPVGPNWRNMVSDEFGWRTDPIDGTTDFHRGIDLHGPAGHPIYASLDGTVITVGTDANHSWGYYIKIDHGGGFTTLYAHNTTTLVTPGQQVTAGQQIATMGRTGRVTGVHLHFEVSSGGELHDPRRYLP